jgi:hypothetical protein
LLDRRTDGAHPAGETFPSVVSLHRTSDGAFGFEDEAGWRLTVTRDGGALVLEQDGAESWVLEEHRHGAGGFVIRSRELPDARELGQTTRSEPTESGASIVSLLLADGRLFRIVARGFPDPRFELLGWEVGGAYLIASPVGDAWRVHRTPAGEELEAGTEILVLFGAEILAQAHRRH